MLQIKTVHYTSLRLSVLFVSYKFRLINTLIFPVDPFNSFAFLFIESTRFLNKFNLDDSYMMSCRNISIFQWINLITELTSINFDPVLSLAFMSKLFCQIRSQSKNCGCLLRKSIVWSWCHLVHRSQINYYSEFHSNIQLEKS